MLVISVDWLAEGQCNYMVTVTAITNSVALSGCESAAPSPKRDGWSLNSTNG